MLYILVYFSSDGIYMRGEVPKGLYADGDDSDQLAYPRKLIRVFAGRTRIFFLFFF